LLPYNVPHPKVYELLDSTGAEALICAAGSLPLDDVAQECKNLRLLTWVVEKTSRHMDWNGVPDSAQGRLNVSVWHDVVQENQDKSNGELPTNETGDTPADVVIVWQPTQVEKKPELVTFTQTNMAAAISALISAIPSRQRFSPDDLVLPASAFSISYVLCQTMAALYTHANLAITSVAQPGVDLALATRGVSPTVIIASAESMVALHTKETAAATSATQKFGKYAQSQAMAAGRLPAGGMLFSLISPSTSTSGNTPGKLRLIFTSERLGAGTPRLTSTMLSDLRIFTRARICYALTTAKVAGAVAQTNVFDYRREEGTGCSHFGVPLSSVEVKLANADDSHLGHAKPTGEIVVSGPAVSGGGDVKLGVQGVFREDGTLALV
jgi:acyl-CoA synthetase (AMP-forming)/AMP-acid ligase II